jgi:CheY-like chemotaxis protein
MINIENLSILVVDDTKSMRLTLREMLKNLFIGKNLWLAENGVEGLEILNTVKCDLALVDWNMPVMNGFEMLEAIRNDKLLRDLPVIMVTAETSQNSVVQAAKMEIDGYLVKPLTLLSLDEKIKAVIQKANLPPNQETLHRLKARELENKGEYKSAIEHIKKALSLNPSSSRLMRRLGILYFKIKKDDIAEKCLLKVVSINEFETITRAHLADYYINKNEIEKAGKYYLEILSLSTQYHDKALNLAKSLLINGYRSMSLDIFSKIITGSIKQDDARETIIDFCLSHNEFGFAQILLEWNFKANPSNYDILYRIGLIQKRLGHWEKALKNFLQVDSQVKNHVKSKLQIAKIYYRNEKIYIADDYLNQILRIDPENQEAIALRRKL